MLAGNYAVLRYIADPARDEPINAGILASGPSGAGFYTDSLALDRMRSVDPSLDPLTLDHVKDYMDRAAREPALRVRPGGIEAVEPWQPGFVDALRGQLPERFTLGRSLFIDYADESREAMDSAGADLVKRLVKPPPRRLAFSEPDPGAPFERLKRLLATFIESGSVRERPDIQGFTRRVRHPDFFYRRADGTAVIILTVKMDYQRPWQLSQAVDARAFELLDVKQSQHAVALALVEQPLQPSPEYFETLKSIQAVADEVLDAQPGVIEVANRVKREFALI